METDQVPRGALTLTCLKRLKREIIIDHVLIVASGLAFHAVLAVLPALAAIAAIWQLLAGPELLKRALESGDGLLPQGALDLAQEFTTSVAEGFGPGLNLLFACMLILWTSQRSASGLITALNIVFDRSERRPLLRRALVALGIACGGMIFLFLSLAALAIFPMLGPVVADNTSAWIVLFRWPLLAIGFWLAVGLLFSYAPHWAKPHWRPFSWGSITATVLWLCASWALSTYVSHAGAFGRFYGSISAVIVLLLWFYVSALAVLTGAELDALLQQRRRERARTNADRPSRASSHTA